MIIGRKLAYDFHSSRWDFQTRRMIEMSMDTFKAAMDVYISYKFGGFLFSIYVINAAQLCSAGIDQHLG